MSALPPMRCGDAAPYLPALADGELAEPLRGQVEAHAAGCHACKAVVQRHQAITRLIATLPASAPAPAVFDRVLERAAAHVTEPVVRESLRRQRRRLFPRTLPAFLAAAGTPTSPPASPRRLTWSARLVPVVAALLLIGMTVAVFHRLPLEDGLRPTGQPTSAHTPPLSVVAQTGQRVAALAAGLAFRPAVPTYLPSGTRLTSASVGPASVGRISRVLDIVWTLAPPLSTLHLREAPVSLSQRNDWAHGIDNPALAWQIEGAPPWLGGTLQDRQALAHLAVGQDRPHFSITLDIAVSGQAGAQPTDAELSALRLVSLSMDQSYQPVTILPPDMSQDVLHVLGQSPAAGLTWETWLDPRTHAEHTNVTAGTIRYTDVSDGQRVLRLDLATGRYMWLAPSAAGDPTGLSSDLQQFFYDANTAVRYGLLWNLGTRVYQGHPVDALYLVNAPWPTYVYVDPASRKIIAARVDYSSTTTPGGPGATSPLTPAGGCMRYTLVEFVAPAAVDARLFATTPFPGYQPGAVPATATTCS